MVWYGRMVVQIIPWYGELKPENIPGIVERGGIRYPMPKIFQKKYSKKNIPARKGIPGIII